jgi:hypothetical protein
MKLSAPEPEITLYEDGFGQNDFLDRAKIGKQLSGLVERVEDPMVIAVDGEWGSGKSFFLRSWVGAHVRENGGTALTVFFDAYKHDFLDDPLIGLTSAIGDRLPQGSKNFKLWEGAKAAAAKLWRPAARIGLAVTTAGASEIAGAVVDAGLSAGEKEVNDAVDRFWKREDGKREAMTQFRNVLLSVAQGKEEREPQRLVVVVDELDRCRPDYALSVLETIKHFFDVNGVHFILGVNLKELRNSVRIRYGAESDAASYLEKFISIILRLPSQVGNVFPSPVPFV